MELAPVILRAMPLFAVMAPPVRSMDPLDELIATEPEPKLSAVVVETEPTLLIVRLLGIPVTEPTESAAVP
jgi:hypothetical protein